MIPNILRRQPSRCVSLMPYEFGGLLYAGNQSGLSCRVACEPSKRAKISLCSFESGAVEKRTRELAECGNRAAECPLSPGQRTARHPQPSAVPLRRVGVLPPAEVKPIRVHVLHDQDRVCAVTCHDEPNKRVATRRSGSVEGSHVAAEFAFGSRRGSTPIGDCGVTPYGFGLNLCQDWLGLRRIGPGRGPACGEGGDQALERIGRARFRRQPGRDTVPAGLDEGKFGKALVAGEGRQRRDKPQNKGDENGEI